MLNLNFDLSVAERSWNAALPTLCGMLNDGAGRAVLAQIGRTIRSPQCCLAPMLMTATQSGDVITFEARSPATGSAST